MAAGTNKSQSGSDNLNFLPSSAPVDSHISTIIANTILVPNITPPSTMA